ncbi:hypothetical protein D3C85_892500 [compost metagenome]
MVEQTFFLANQAFRVAVVTAGERQLQPMASRDQVAGEQHRPARHGDFRQQLPGGVAITEMKLPTTAEQIVVGALDQRQAIAVFQSIEDRRDEQCPVTRMRAPGALPMTFTHQVTGIGK